MKIKTKLRLGFGFLFVVVTFFGAVSLVYMDKVSVSAKVILQDNYESLSFVRAMRTVLDENELPLAPAAVARFQANLRLESGNVTEKGEGQAVTALERAFAELRAPLPLTVQRQALKKVHLQLRRIDELNMKAIVRKNEAAQAGVEKAATYLIFAASLCFIVLFSFSVNFPGFVAGPLKELSEAIKAISRKNYKQRLEIGGHDEFSELAAEFNTMVSQLNKWENSNLAKLQSEKLRIDAIIEQMQDAIIGLNEQKEILFLNKVAAQLLNLNEKDVIGANALELMKRNDLLASIMQVKNADKPMKIYADSKESYFQLERREIVVTTIDDRQEQVISEASKTAGEVYVLKNITQYKELDEAKTNFIATVSHELKTPISSIKMSLKLLGDDRVGGMNPEQKELVQHIKEDCGRLLKITSELLDLSQVETGNLQLNFVKTDPRKIAIYAMDAIRFQTEQKQIQLELAAANDLPKVNIDTEKTTWVLINFLSNALRYSAPKSQIIIRVVQLAGTIEFSVQDFGKGIDEQYQKRLFDRYFQVPTDGQNKSGTGLGLAISKDFITAQQGEIWVESAIGEGSRFCFTLPAMIG